MLYIQLAAIEISRLTSYRWSAICRGAVIRGLTRSSISTPGMTTVRSRVARASYGVLCYHEYLDGIDDEEDKFWNDGYDAWSAHTIRWFLEVVRYTV